MTTYAVTTVLAHTTDADFRAWGAEFKAALTAAGLTNTADTGQIDWATVLIPGGGGQAGYEIWRFNDVLQATSPIFIRFDYGSQSAGIPMIWVQAGVATDGAGNFVGQVSTVLTPLTLGAAIDSLVTPYASYFTYNAALGMLGIAWKLGSNGISQPGRGLMMLGRSCNSSGAALAQGATLYTGGVSPAVAQAMKFSAPAATYLQHANYAIVVGNVLGSVVGSDVQAYLNWTHYPRVEPINWACTVITDEFPRGTTFPATLVGATPRTYLALGQASPVASPGGNSSHYSFAMLYE